VATGSDKRLTPAQRKKDLARYRKSGRRKDPATDLVLGAASMVPVAGVGARAAGVARAAQAAKKATMKVKEPKSNVKVIKKPQRDPGELKYRVDPIEKVAYRDAMRTKIDPRRKAKESPLRSPYPKPVKKRVPPKRNPNKPKDQVREKEYPLRAPYPKKKKPLKPLPAKKVPPKKKAPAKKRVPGSNNVRYSAGSGKL